MNESEVLAFLRAEIRRIRPALPEEFPADSLDRVELVARIEQHYGLLIPDSELPQFTSLEAAAQYILARTRS